MLRVPTRSAPRASAQQHNCGFQPKVVRGGVPASLLPCLRAPPGAARAGVLPASLPPELLFPASPTRRCIPGCNWTCAGKTRARSIVDEVQLEELPVDADSSELLSMTFSLKQARHDASKREPCGISLP